MTEETLLWNRFLLGVDKKKIPGDPHDRILYICRRMGMPANLLEKFEENLPAGNYVHFGFEENKQTCVYKVYLEFYDKFEGEIKDRPDTYDPFLLHLGFKWDTSDSTKHALTKYTWHPGLSLKEIKEKVADVYHGPEYGTSLEIVRRILDLTSDRMNHNAILYLEVMEDNNPRRSFDINLYKAGLKLKDLNSPLVKMCKHYRIPAEKYDILCNRISEEAFGHMSGGIDREGKDFLTIYYGVEYIIIE